MVALEIEVRNILVDVVEAEVVREARSRNYTQKQPEPVVRDVRPLSVLALDIFPCRPVCAAETGYSEPQEQQNSNKSISNHGRSFNC